VTSTCNQPVTLAGRPGSVAGCCDTAVVIMVTRDDERARYEGRLDGGELITVIHFDRTDDVVDITYTGTKRRHRGHGFASSITKQALDDIRAEGWKVRPTCSFTATYLDEHPEYADLRT
jgi:uncharacterized protein